MNESADLGNLRDVVVPETPSMWPPADGVWILAAVAAGILAVLFLIWRRSRAASAYRRAGLALLADARSSRDLTVVLKRVALAAFPRPVVAPLHGAEWVGFLESTCSRARFALLDSSLPEVDASPEQRDLARTWIRHHRSGGA